MAASKSTKNQLGVDLPDPQVIENDIVVEEEEEAKRPEWLPENFKDESEFASAYKEAQNKIREQGEQQKSMEGRIAQLTSVVEKLQTSEPPRTRGDDDAVREQLTAAFESDPIGTIAYLASQYSEQTVDRKMAALQQEQDPRLRAQSEAQNEMLAMTVDRDLSAKLEDWPEYRDRVAEEISNDPTLLDERVLQSGPQATARALERVYKMVKAEDVLKGQSNDRSSETMKRQAQTLTGNGSRPGEPTAEDEKFARLQAAATGMSYSAWRG